MPVPSSCCHSGLERQQNDLNGPGQTRTDCDSGSELMIHQRLSAENGANLLVAIQDDPRLLEIVKLWGQLSEEAKCGISGFFRAMH